MSSTQKSRPAEAELAEYAAIAGARTMLAEIASGRAVEAERKDDFTFVMNLDLMADAAIQSVLGARSRVVSEEAPESHKVLGSKADYFLVDPLDGTNNCRRVLSFFGPALYPMQESFGPIVGFIREGVIESATFVSLTESLVWSAARGGGCTVTPLSDKLMEFEARERIIAPIAPRLRECGVLFYPGKHGELELVTHLRTQELIDGCYRLGGFGGDCTRVVRGREQILIQFSLKPWDLVAALLATEAGAIALDFTPTGVRVLDKMMAFPTGKIIVANRGCAQELERVLESMAAKSTQ